jgi:hypothetical protein
MKVIFNIRFFFIVIQSYSASYYLDPINGNINNDGSAINPWPSLQEVIAVGMIESFQYSNLPYDGSNSPIIIKNMNAPISGGDTLILMNGLHGEIFLRNYINKSPITIIGALGEKAILKSLHIQSGKHWRFQNLEISSEPYGDYLNNRLVYFESHGFHGPCSHIEINECWIYSSDRPWTEAYEWLNNVSSGIYMRGDSMQAINNIVTNVDHGITAYGDYIIARNNSIVNFSGDGMRVLGSHITFESNLIKNCYDVDDNHDDGIQSFTTNGIVVDNNTILGNTIINTDDVNRPLNGPLQGIGCFDGIYNNWYVANNLIYVDHWHGITFLGANNCQIINNTVLDPTPDITPGASWIRIADHKDGTPSTNCVVKNNVTNQLVVDAEDSHNAILSTYEDYEANFVDYLSFDFHLKEGSDLINAANVSISPPSDIEGTDRLYDGQSDIGAYEYDGISSTLRGSEEVIFEVYPNPFSDFLKLKSNDKSTRFSLYTIDGVWVKSLMVDIDNDVSELQFGIYFIFAKNASLKYSRSEMLLKIK